MDFQSIVVQFPKYTCCSLKKKKKLTRFETAPLFMAFRFSEDPSGFGEASGCDRPRCCGFALPVRRRLLHRQPDPNVPCNALERIGGERKGKGDNFIFSFSRPGWQGIFHCLRHLIARLIPQTTILLNRFTSFTRRAHQTRLTGRKRFSRFPDRKPKRNSRCGICPMWFLS